MELKNDADVSVCMGLWWKGETFQKQQKKRKRKEVFLHSDCTRLFIIIAHMHSLQFSYCLIILLWCLFSVELLQLNELFLDPWKFNGSKISQKVVLEVLDRTRVVSKLNFKSLVPAWIPGLFAIHLANQKCATFSLAEVSAAI